jgi:ATP adenylyltransferase
MAKRPHHEPPTNPPQPTLSAPWRQEYLEGMDKPAPAGAVSSSGSFLRDYWLAPQDDEKNHVIVRTGDGIILLNRYPYAGGHLLVALGEARPRLLDYAPEQRSKLWDLVAVAAGLMDRALNPQGINYGINEGRAAGAGVPQHLHAHLVPRWGGDVNFMATVGNVRVIPASLEAMAARYRAVAAEKR